LRLNRIVRSSRFPFEKELRLTLKLGGAMSDGREEREERKARIEQEKQKDREDRIDREEPDEWQPERVDS
jgi:hypothetical protein